MKYTFIIYGSVDDSPYESVGDNVLDFEIPWKHTIKIAEYSLKSNKHLDDAEVQNIENMIKSKFGEKFKDVSVELIMN